MKVVCLLGSPRLKGNSATLAGEFCNTARKRGAAVRTFALNKLSYRGCQACMACKKKRDKCVLKDDLAPVLEAVRDCDVLVMATPTYYGEVSSQLKAFIDRTYSYLVPDFVTNPQPSRLAPGKKLVFIQTQTDPDAAHFGDVFIRYQSFFQWYGFRECRLVRATGVSEVGDVLKKKAVLKLAAKTAAEVIG